MKARTYEFEGQQRTLAQIRELVPVLGDAAIEMRLARGMKTRSAMLAFDANAARRAGGRRGRAVVGDRLSFGRGQR